MAVYIPALGQMRSIVPSALGAGELNGLSLNHRVSSRIKTSEAKSCIGIQYTNAAHIP